MQRLEVSGAVRPLEGSLGVKWLKSSSDAFKELRLCESTKTKARNFTIDVMKTVGGGGVGVASCTLWPL